LFNGLFARTTWVSRHQKGKAFWILLEQEMMGCQWHQLDHMEIICSSLQTDYQFTTPVPHHSVLTGRMPFLLPNQQCQSTEGKALKAKKLKYYRKFTTVNKNDIGPLSK